MFSIGEYYGWMFFLSCWLSMIKHKAILHGGFRPHAHNHCEREERKLNFPHLSHSTSFTTGHQLNCWGVLEWELKSTWAVMRKLISTFQLLVGGGDHFEFFFNHMITAWHRKQLCHESSAEQSKLITWRRKKSVLKFLSFLPLFTSKCRVISSRENRRRCRQCWWHFDNLNLWVFPTEKQEKLITFSDSLPISSQLSPRKLWKCF